MAKSNWLPLDGMLMIIMDTIIRRIKMKVGINNQPNLIDTPQWNADGNYGYNYKTNKNESRNKQAAKSNWFPSMEC